jgi:hypothetical protein
MEVPMTETPFTADPESPRPGAAYCRRCGFKAKHHPRYYDGAEPPHDPRICRGFRPHRYSRRAAFASGIGGELDHGTAVAIGYAVGFVLFVVGLSVLLVLTEAILGHPAADGPKAWFVLGPGLIIGAGVVFGGAHWTIARCESAFERILRRWRALL